jgi:hypothetical protein
VRPLVLMLLASAASAQSLAVTVMDAQSVSEKEQKKLHAQAVAALKSLSALPVDAEWKGVPKRGCAMMDLGCQRERVRAAGAPAVVGLWLKGADRLEAVLFVDGDRVTDAADSVAGALPPWVRKGWGGFRLPERLPAGTVLKVDGRVLPVKSDVLPVTAGPHELDVLFPDGSAVLQHIEVTEGSRTRVDTRPPQPEPTVESSSVPGLRISAYAAWMVGSATLLSAFVVAFAGRATANGQNPCAVTSRECVTYAMASDASLASGQYAITANALLGTGLGLCLIGAGLFLLDVFKGRL